MSADLDALVALVPFAGHLGLVSARTTQVQAVR
jgi:hypothetical protein